MDLGLDISIEKFKSHIYPTQAKELFFKEV
jgi:hypothetical protein